jgi:formimidoylglutamate deiminase
LNVHSLWFNEALLAGGWAKEVRLTIDGGKIIAIAHGVARAPNDAVHAIALPGLANVHSHAFQRGMAGLAERRGPAHDDFWTWRDVMYRFLDRLTPEDVEAITAQAYVEMLECGFTRVGEFHYLHNDIDGRPYPNRGELIGRIVAAAAETGIALTLLPVFYAHSSFGGAAPTAGQRRFLSNPEGFGKLIEAARSAARELPDAVVGIAPHSLRAVTPEELDAILPLAKGGPVHIHAAEQMKEVEDCLAWSGARPVQWLLGHTAINEHWCLVHATHMTHDETVRLARSGATAGLCPITEANLGDGIFPSSTYLTAGGRFAVGTDSNILIDAAGELRALEYAQRLSARSRNVLAVRQGESVGAELFNDAVIGGARALGAQEMALLVGASADIVGLDADDPSLVARHGDALIDGLIFAGAKVGSVWRRGEQLVMNGEHKKSAVIAERYRKTITRLLA